MRHRKNRFNLERFSAWQKATQRQLIRSLLIAESIKTTKAKAKLAQRQAEKLIRLGLEPSLSSKRRAYSALGDHKLVNRLFNDIAPRFKSNKGGYTKIISIGTRLGDNSSCVIFELTKKKIKEKPKKISKEKKPKPEEETTPEARPQKEKVAPPASKEKIKKEQKPRKFFKGIRKLFKKERDSL